MSFISLAGFVWPFPIFKALPLGYLPPKRQIDGTQIAGQGGKGTQSSCLDGEEIELRELRQQGDGANCLAKTVSYRDWRQQEDGANCLLVIVSYGYLLPSDDDVI